MKSIRVIGFKVEESLKKQNKSKDVLSKRIQCSLGDLEHFLKGRKMLNYSQLREVADYLNMNIDELVKPNDDNYNLGFVDCMTDFKSIDNREEILDDIYDYLDLVDEYAN